tara:strand:+ start:100 stop:960 length:861 start_codon:yes stop_codon:yes gene_type:complete
MPNGHSRNRNSRHANTQRHIRQAEIISAQSIEIINDVIVEAEAFVDHSAEHREETLALKKRLDKSEKKEKETYAINCEYRRCLDDLHQRKIITISNHPSGMEIEFNGIQLKNGKYIQFKDTERVLNEAMDVHQDGKKLVDKLNRENEKLKEFCKTLIEKNESDKKLVEGCRKECAFVLEKAIKLSEEKEKKPGWKFFKLDDDLVCDINFSDEESDEESPPPQGKKKKGQCSRTYIREIGQDWFYNKNFELHHENGNFIRKFDSRDEIITYFRTSNQHKTLKAIGAI